MCIHTYVYIRIGMACTLHIGMACIDTYACNTHTSSEHLDMAKTQAISVYVCMRVCMDCIHAGVSIDVYACIHTSTSHIGRANP